MRKYLIGIIIGASIATVAPSYAEIGSKIEAVFSDIKVEINGDIADLSEPLLIVDGISYVPLKDIATRLNYRVNYENSRRTTVLKNNIEVYYFNNQTYYSIKEINENKENPTLVAVISGRKYNYLYNGEIYVFDSILDYYYDNFTHEKYISTEALSRFSPQIKLETLKKYKINRKDNIIYEDNISNIK